MATSFPTFQTLAENVTTEGFYQTEGFYSVGDGGNSFYYVSNNVNNFNLKTNNGLFCLPLSNNVKAYGVNANGINDCSAVLNNLFDNFDGELYFPQGSYAIYEPLNNQKCSIYANNATIIAMNAMDYVMHIGNTERGTSDDFIYNLSVYGLTVDGNSKAKNGITADLLINCCIAMCLIKNFTESGIKTKTFENSEVAEFGVVRTYIIGMNNINSFGLNLQLADSYIDSVTVRNCQTGISVASNCKLNNCHCWLTDNTLFPSSICFNINGHGCDLINCTSDTMNIGINISGPYWVNVVNHRFTFMSNISPQINNNTFCVNGVDGSRIFCINSTFFSPVNKVITLVPNVMIIEASPFEYSAFFNCSFTANGFINQSNLNINAFLDQLKSNA